jgi:membrane protein DedA with SNARE-associated domain
LFEEVFVGYFFWAAIAVLALFLSVNVVSLQESLKTTFLPITSWILILLIAFAATFWLEAKKLVQRSP